MGKFNILSTFDNIFCPGCPYKSISKKPMFVFRVILKECMWNIDGWIQLRGGPVAHENLGNRSYTVEGEQEGVVQDIFDVARRRG
jgi:hypothetical protein